MKIVINTCFGGFGLSAEALAALGLESDSSLYDDRTNPRLIDVVERLGENADGPHAELKVVEIPNGIEWSIHEYDGTESIHEKHRSWR